jgi:hypothetical protein
MPEATTTIESSTEVTPVVAPVTTEATAAVATTAAPTVTSDPVVTDPAAGYWPDDWRDRLSSGDEKLRARLDRFADPAAILKSMQAAEQKIRSGEYKKGQPGKDATADEIAAWKAENGIPDSWEGYEVDLGNGVVFGDEDKLTVDTIRQFAHENSMPPAEAKKLLGLYDQIKQREADALHDREEAHRAATQDDLRAEWGGDYRRNINIIGGLFESAPEGFKDAFAQARMADGTLLGDNAECMKFLAGLARELNPMATVVPGSAATAAKSIDEELASIDAERRKDHSAFMKNESLRKRERELLDAQTKLNARRG